MNFIVTASVLKRYAGKNAFAMFIAPGIPSGGTGLSAGTPYLTVNTPSVFKKILSILGR